VPVTKKAQRHNTTQKQHKYTNTNTKQNENMAGKRQYKKYWNNNNNNNNNNNKILLLQNTMTAEH
jgi:hypothetical protein